jgi:hypothetical protein
MRHAPKQPRERPTPTAVEAELPADASHPLLSTPTTTHDTMLGLRTATRAPFALSAFRNTAARRWSSGIGAKGLEGPADNAFNRERAAVKQHAADTSGECA